jgi:3-dehydroquinate dehydratase-2
VRVAVLNGVNLDVLARRQPDVYGGESHEELETLIYRWAVELGMSVQVRQTNHEGQYVEWCHEALDWADGVVANPAAWTHYSYAIHDALELFTVPVVEVHLSNVEEREDWRRRTVIADVAATRIMGKGVEGYRDALAYLAGRQ